jgi:predicted glycoside hydrolase/deacetylase ChbG (UPF0249 family)
MRLKSRQLIVVADDYGIGPATSQAIRELAYAGAVTASVLLVNSPYAEQEVQLWRKGAVPADLGWHPNLTLDAPISSAVDVPSLIDRDGQFHPVHRFVKRLFVGRINRAEIELELAAQYRRFTDLVGRPPQLVNGHKHLHVLPICRAVLRDLLVKQGIRPLVRHIRESWLCLRTIRGARLKRLALCALGRRAAPLYRAAGFPANDYLLGITDPPCVRDPDFFNRWLWNVPGRLVELCVHPGHWDPTLLGRDCTRRDGQLRRRVLEYHWLAQPSFKAAARAAGFELIRPASLFRPEWEGVAYAC